MAKKKQNIIITDPAINLQIERAIPKLMREDGYTRERATAAAIRMGSVGQLGPQGQPVRVRTARGGAAIAAMVATRALRTDTQPTRTTESSSIGIVATSPLAFQNALNRRAKKK